MKKKTAGTSIRWKLEWSEPPGRKAGTMYEIPEPCVAFVMSGRKSVEVSAPKTWNSGFASLPIMSKFSMVKI